MARGSSGRTHRGGSMVPCGSRPHPATMISVSRSEAVLGRKSHAMQMFLTHFAQSGWLFLLPLCAVLYWFARGRTHRVGWSIIGAALCLIGAAGPRWGDDESASSAIGSDIVAVVDVSR